MATVVELRPETPRAKTLRLRLPEVSSHLAGQHYIVRLTAEDGYTAQRSYSVASPPDGTAEIEITVERLPEGEVSTFLHEELMVGDELEVRGPIGGWFTYRADSPALLIGGGSGIVPLMAMLRLARQQGVADLVRMLVSVRRPGDLYYSEELPGPETAVIYTRQSPPSSSRPAGHLTAADLGPVADGTTTYICGSSPFADAATDLAVAAGARLEQIRIERFGPTG